MAQRRRSAEPLDAAVEMALGFGDLHWTAAADECYLRVRDLEEVYDG